MEGPNMMKKLAALGLGAALLLSLGGCMADPTVETPSPGSTVSTVTAAPAPAAMPTFTDRGMRIALCTSPGAVDDRGHNAAAYEGVLSFIIERGAMDTVTPLQETTGDSESCLQSLRQMADSYDALVCVGSSFAEVAEVAKEFPQKYFILVDAEAAGEADNLCAVSFAEEQCGFFAGIAAAMETSTDRIAVLSDVASPANIRYYYGFRSGVAYTNGNFGTNAELVDLPDYAGTAADGTNLGGNYTGSLSDDGTGYALANALAAQNCDVLFVAAGASGKGAYAAAKEMEGVWIIGSELDHFNDGQDGERNVVLTSVTKSMALEVERRLNAAAGGTFQSGNEHLTAAQNATGYVTAEDHQQLKPETLKILSDSYPMMQDGTIVPGTGPQ